MSERSIGSAFKSHIKQSQRDAKARKNFADWGEMASFCRDRTRLSCDSYIER
jgi:hypothetical protein